MGAREIAARIASGDLSAREVVEQHIHRIEEVNPRLNAVVVPLFDRALREADTADAARSRGEPPGPLHGVPVTIKEQFLVSGTPTTVGLPARASHRAAGDGPLVRRLRQAGAIVVGKTNARSCSSTTRATTPSTAAPTIPGIWRGRPAAAAAARRRSSAQEAPLSASGATSGAAFAFRPTSAAYTASNRRRGGSPPSTPRPRSSAGGRRRSSGNLALWLVR
jgi:Asp-tRNA(Asn)/Glu-tRNA(Gln) amidotransferase A subunit family amidase